MNPSASVGGDERIRLFCALTLPEDVLDRLVAWQAALPDGRYRPVRRENLHVTLAFLGSVGREHVDSIAAALAVAARDAGPIVLHERRYRETRSVGMLVFDDEEGAAGTLAVDLHQRLERLGVYRRETRPWLPHLTVVRFRLPPRLAPDLPALGPVSPSGAAVYHSVLRPSGAQYVVVHGVGVGR